MSRLPSDLADLRDVLVYLEGIGYGELYLPGGGEAEAPPSPASASRSHGTPPATAAPPSGSPEPRAGGIEALPPSAEDRAAALAAVAEEAAVCEKCRLYRGRTTVVFGTGDPDADLMFIGEGPGAEEDRQGRPTAAR